MDPDSFLNLQSSDLEDSEEWCPSPDAQFWDQDSREPSQLSFRDSYSSVLKLSDIASALKVFSRTEVQASPVRSSTLTPSTSWIKQSISNSMTDSLERDLLSDKSTENLVGSGVPSSHMEVKSCCLKPFSSSKRMKLSLTNSDRHEVANLELQHKSIRKQSLSQREVHIYSERQRRKCMTDSFTTLQSLIPKLKNQHTDRVTVLTEVITYIRSLRGTLEGLERKKSDILDILSLAEKTTAKGHVRSAAGRADSFKRNCSNFRDDGVSSVEVTARLAGKDVFITLNIPKRKGVWSGVLMLLQRHGVEIVNATLTVCGENNFHCIHGKVVCVDKLKGVDLQNKLEDLIAKELNGWPKW